jgi:hypothetical protein
MHQARVFFLLVSGFWTLVSPATAGVVPNPKCQAGLIFLRYGDGRTLLIFNLDSAVEAVMDFPFSSGGNK